MNSNSVDILFKLGIGKTPQIMIASYNRNGSRGDNQVGEKKTLRITIQPWSHEAENNGQIRTPIRVLQCLFQNINNKEPSDELVKKAKQ